MFVTAAYAQSDPTTGTHTGTSPAPAGEKPHFPPFDAHLFPSQLLWLAISFVIFYFFVQKTLLPRIGGVLEIRRDRIANDLDEAGRLNEEADAAIAAYEQQLAEARRNAEAIAQQAHDKARAEAEAQRGEVEGELARKTAEAENDIARIKSQALAEIGNVAEEVSQAIVQQLIGASVTRAEAARGHCRGRRIGRPEMELDNTFWAFIALVLFLALMVYIKLPAWIGKQLDKRADDIRRELDEARRLREEARQVLAEYERKRKEAEAEAVEIRKAAERDAAIFLDEAKQKTEEYVARRQQIAEQKIRQAETDAANEVRASAVDLAVAAAGRLLADKTDDTRANALFRELARRIEGPDELTAVTAGR